MSQYRSVKPPRYFLVRSLGDGTWPELIANFGEARFLKVPQYWRVTPRRLTALGNARGGI